MSLMDASDTDLIEIVGLQAYGYHGVFAHERDNGQMFFADITLSVNPSAHDDLSTTVDYGAVADAAHAILGGPPVNLIETVAEMIADACLDFTGVRAVEVAIHKPSAPVTVPVRDIVVRLVRRKSA